MSRRRIIKKRLRDNQPRATLEGNKGGSFVEITPMTGERCYIRSGCSCVMSLDSIVPNEFLPMLIQDCIFRYGTVEKFIQDSSYSQGYKDSMIMKIEN